MILKPIISKERRAKFKLIFRDTDWQVGQKIESPVTDDTGKIVEFAGKGYVHRIDREPLFVIVTIKYFWWEFSDGISGDLLAVDGS